MDAELEDLLGVYWDLAYEEGSIKASNGTKANEVLHKIREAWNRRASPASVPANFKMVPVEPTMEMCEAGWNEYDLQEHFSVRFMYERMIAAAPTPPVSEDRKDADRLNYLQEHGATVHLVSTTNSNLLSFVIGGLHRSKRLNLREAIDAAMQEDKP